MVSIFTTEEKDNVFIIHFPTAWDKSAASEFEKNSSTWLLRMTPVFAFDFKNVQHIDANYLRTLLLFSKTLKLNKKSLYTIQTSAEVQKELQQAGCSQALSLVSSLEEIIKEMGHQESKKKLIDVRYVNPFIDAAIHTLDIQCQTKATAKPLFIKSEANNPPVEIAGVITLICDQFYGSISLCFTNSVFLNIYEKMIGEKHTEITSEIQDAASELLNIIYGTAKSKLNSELNTNLKPALPTVLVGDNIRIHRQTFGPTIIVPMESNSGNFHIEIAIDTNHQRK